MEHTHEKSYNLPSDAQIADHLANDTPLEGHGSVDVEAAILDWINANPQAVEEIRRRNVAKVEEENRRYLEKYTREKNEFNRKIQERKAALLKARPVVELLDYGVTQHKDGAQGWARIRVSVGNGPGPIDEYYVVHRAAHKAMEFAGGWSKWMVDRKPRHLPFVEMVRLLDPGQDHELSAIGGNKYGRVEAIPVRVSFKQPKAGPAEQKTDQPVEVPEQQQAAPEDNAATPRRFVSGEIGGGRYGFSSITSRPWVISQTGGSLDRADADGILACYEAKPGQGNGAGWIATRAGVQVNALHINGERVPFRRVGETSDGGERRWLYKADPGTVPWPDRDARAGGIEVVID